MLTSRVGWRVMGKAREFLADQASKAERTLGFRSPTPLPAATVTLGLGLHPSELWLPYL